MKKAHLYFAAACAVLILAIALTRVGRAGSAIPLGRPLGEIPMRISGFTGVENHMRGGAFRYGSADDWILRRYEKGDAGPPVMLFLGYWRNQDEGKVILSPRYTSHRWEQYSVETKSVPGDAQDIYVLKEFITDRGQDKELVYYCYILDGEVIPDDYTYRLKRMLNSLFRGRNNAALLKISIPVADDAGLESARERAEAFLREFMPFVSEYLPGTGP